MFDLKKNREKSKDSRGALETEVQNQLDSYSVGLIKIIGGVGAFMGMVILGFFWFWVLSKLF